MTVEGQMVAGKNFLHIEDFIKHKWGTEGLDSFKSRSDIGNDKIFEEKLYPFEDYIEYLESVQNVFEDKTSAYQIGLHRARNLLLAKGIGNYGLEILDKVAIAWPKFNNFGKVDVEHITKTKVSVVLSNYDSHPLYCERMRGFFTGLVSGVMKDTCYVQEVNCVCNGNKVCEYSIELQK